MMSEFWRCRICLDANAVVSATCSTCKSKRESAQIAPGATTVSQALERPPLSSIEVTQPATSADGRYIPASMRSKRTTADLPPETKPQLKAPLDLGLLQTLIAPAASGAAQRATGAGAASGKAAS